MSLSSSQMDIGLKAESPTENFAGLLLAKHSSSVLVEPTPTMQLTLYAPISLERTISLKELSAI
jgi:hypothetical protein